MSVKVDDLVPGEVYVTRGGTVVMKGDPTHEEVPWGYERVRFLRLTDSHIVVETPWGTECELPRDYTLYSTGEGMLRSEFSLRGVHESCKIIPFDEALKKGIAKELSAAELQELMQAEANASTRPAAVRPKDVVRNEFMDRLIKYFEVPHTYTEAAKHLDTTYQKIRYTLNKLKTDGYGLQRFRIELTKDKPPKTKLERL